MPKRIAAGIFALFLALTGCSPKIAPKAPQIAEINTPRFVPAADINNFKYDTIPQWMYPNDSLYITDSFPDAATFLPPPPPPDTTSAQFSWDFGIWKWGKSQRETERGRQASQESLYGIVRMCTIYSEIFGFVIHPDTTPAIYRFMLYAGETAYRATISAKNKYHRPRPFELMNDSIWGEFDGEYLRGDGSYPSGHAALGWATALALTKMITDKDGTCDKDLIKFITWRGYQYGESRVIVGAHWQSDFEAGMDVAETIFPEMCKSPRYQQHLEAARKEYHLLAQQQK